MYRKALIIIVSLAFLTACNSVSNEKAGSTNSAQSTSMNNASSTGNSAKLNMYTAAPAELSQDELTGTKAVIHTSKGDIEIKFFGEDAPKTVSNFIFLSNAKFYDNLTFHRREEGFVIQGGDPAGTGGGGPGYNVPAEINTHKHIRGAVAMARLPDSINPKKESSGSQFYICLDDASFLDGQYTVFGQVTKGMEVVDQIKVGDNILSVTISK